MTTEQYEYRELRTTKEVTGTVIKEFVDEHNLQDWWLDHFQTSFNYAGIDFYILKFKRRVA